MIRRAVVLRGARARRLLEHLPFLAIDENDIDVGTVIKLLSPEFAQTNDRKPGGLPPLARILMVRLAEAFGQWPIAELQHAGQTNIRDVGNLPCDVRRAAQARQIARADPQHLALFKLPEACQGGGVIARQDGRLQPRIHFAAQPLFAARVAQVVWPQRGHPVGMLHQQRAQSGRTAK